LKHGGNIGRAADQRADCRIGAADLDFESNARMLLRELRMMIAALRKAAKSAKV
jgi:hypothetical protein